jgi:tetratricopeptide (TPR) repeat protein
MKHFQHSIDLNDTLAEPQLALAVVLYQQGNQTEALKLAKTALALDPQFADPTYQRLYLWGEKLVSDTQKLLAALQ